MAFLRKHPLYTLKYADSPASFVIKDSRKMTQASEQAHQHSYYSLIWSYNAAGKHIIDCNEYVFAPDHLFVISPGQVHLIDSNPKPEGILILFTPEFLFKNELQCDFIQKLHIFSQKRDSSPLALPTQSAQRLQSHANEMMSAFYSDKAWKYESIEAHLKLFLIECNEQFLLSYPQGESHSPETDLRLASAFKTLVEEHCHEWHQVQEYANKLNVTANYLGDQVRQSLHISAKDYISQQLITEAKRMGIYSGDSLKEIGYRLGFEDPNRFSRFFRDAAGVSFQRFKNSIKKL